MNKIILSLFFIFIIANCCALEENVTGQEKVEICLNDSLRIIENLEVNDISVERVTDIYESINDSYFVQLFLKRQNRKYDFSSILEECEEIKNVEELAVLSKDLIEGLNIFYSEYIAEDMDSSSVDVIIDEINREYNNERYENIEVLVNKAYAEIIDVRSSHTTLNLFYNSTKSALFSFFVDNYEVLILIVIGIFVFLLLFYRRIKASILNFKKHKLELRRKVLDELIKKSQREYFERGKMSKGMYEIRLHKFSDLIRDIDREILLIKERMLRNKKSQRIKMKDAYNRNKKRGLKLERQKKKESGRGKKNKKESGYGKNKSSKKSKRKS